MSRFTELPFETRSVRIAAGSVHLNGDLNIPADAAAIVIFAHGSGSSRKSTRNRYVAGVLNEAGFATLLMDLLTLDEEAADMRTGNLRFDIPFLAERVSQATEFVKSDDGTRGMRIGYFGASTGAGAALMAAAQRPSQIGAIVSRGGRPDLAAHFLPQVTAPTLLIVGQNDEAVIGMNQQAMRRMRGVVEMAIVPGATHLFEEPGTLEQAAGLARDWFERHLPTSR